MIDEFIGFFAPNEFSLLKTINGSSSIEDYYKNWCKRFLVNLNNIIESFYAADVGFPNMFNLDASADTIEESGRKKDIIEINSGVIFKCYKNMYMLVSSCNVLNRFSIEFKNENGIGVKCCYKFDDYQDYDFIISLPNTNDILLADFMSKISIEFIILHEIGHLYNGHVSLHKLSSNTNLNKLLMTFLSIDTTLTILDYKTMEMDADAFAITNLIDDIISFWSADTRLQVFCPKLLDLLYLIGFSLNILFLMVHDENTKVYSSYNTNQLNYENRANMLFGAFNTCVHEKLNSVCIIDFRKYITKAILHSTIYYNAIYKKENTWTENSESGDSVKNQNEILENWKSLRNKLLPLSRIGLAP